MKSISRRRFLSAGGIAAGSIAVAGNPTTAQADRRSDIAQTDRHREMGSQPGPANGQMRFFNPGEAAFVRAAVARLIPSDELPGAIEAGVDQFIDIQLGGAWGAGERLFRGGPWHPGSPSQGYQLPFTPAELFRNALRAIASDVELKGKGPFEHWHAKDQDAYLTELQKGTRDLGGVPSNVFFESLWGLTVEGFLCDPVYGGNRGMVSWKMIGFPGAYANYYHLIDQHGIAFTRAPMSLADNGRGEVMLHPDIPAQPMAKGQ